VKACWRRGRPGISMRGAEAPRSVKESSLRGFINSASARLALRVVFLGVSAPLRENYCRIKANLVLHVEEFLGGTLLLHRLPIPDSERGPRRPGEEYRSK
jgi:hypothetical protein